MEKIISYIGSKVNLYDFLEEIIVNPLNKEDSKINFLDLFSGTNSVSNLIKQKTEWNVIANDLSKYSNVLFSFLHFDMLSQTEHDNIIKQLHYLDSLELIKGDIFHEFSENGKPKSIDPAVYGKMFDNQPVYSRMFFKDIVGMKLDTIKTGIIDLYNKKIISDIERDILITFMVNYADKNANTTSVYGAYLKHFKAKNIKPFLDIKLLNLLKVSNNTERRDKYNSYSNDVISTLTNLKGTLESSKKNNVVYFDPPYNTRSYEGNYHILNYIVDLNFNPERDIKVNSKTASNAEKSKNPFVSKKLTEGIFKDMILESLPISEKIYISYNTDGLIQQSDLERIIEEIKVEYKNITLTTHTKNYKRFKSANNKHKKLQQEKNILNKYLMKKDFSKYTKTEIDNRLVEIKKIIETEKDDIQEEKILYEIIWEIQNNG